MILTVAGWKAYYESGKVYSSKDIKWADLPADGMLGYIVFYNETHDGVRPYRMIHHGTDYYFSDDKELFASNNDTLADNQSRYPDCSFKRGKWVSALEIETVQKDMLKDELL